LALRGGIKQRDYASSEVLRVNGTYAGFSSLNFFMKVTRA